MMIIALMALALTVLTLLHNHDWNRDTNEAFMFDFEPQNLSLQSS
jgi:hypothetical protein